MEKSIYYIESFIPEDENLVYNKIFKLISLGNKNKIYLFVGINTNHGFGTALDDFGYKSEKEAILGIIKISGFNNEEKTLKNLIECDLLKALEISNEYNLILTKKLN